MMKRIKKCLLANVLVATLLLAGTIPLFAAGEEPLADQPAVVVAQDEALKPWGEAAVCVLSNYINMGQQLTRHSVVIQPSMTVGLKGFWVNIWGNLDMSPYNPYNTEDPDVIKNKASNWTETDFTIGYDRTFGMVNTTISYAYYGNAASRNFDADARDQHEAILSATLNTLLSPNMTVYWEFDVAPRLYVKAGVSHSIPLNKTLSAKIAVTAAYMYSMLEPNPNTDNKYRNKIHDDGSPSDERYNGFYDGNVALSFPYKPMENITITPNIAYSFPLCTNARNNIRFNGLANFDAMEADYIYGGVTFAYGF